MTEDLKPCPFCGGEPEMFSRTTTLIRCANDQCISRPEPFNDVGHKAEAIAAWNTRAAEPAPGDEQAVGNHIADAGNMIQQLAAARAELADKDAEIERLKGDALNAKMWRISYVSMEDRLRAMSAIEKERRREIKALKASQATRDTLLATLAQALRMVQPHVGWGHGFDVEDVTCVVDEALALYDDHTKGSK